MVYVVIFSSYITYRRGYKRHPVLATESLVMSAYPSFRILTNPTPSHILIAYARTPSPCNIGCLWHSSSDNPCATVHNLFLVKDIFGLLLYEGVNCSGYL